MERQTPGAVVLSPAPFQKRPQSTMGIRISSLPHSHLRAPGPFASGAVRLLLCALDCKASLAGALDVLHRIEVRHLELRTPVVPSHASRPVERSNVGPVRFRSRRVLSFNQRLPLPLHHRNPERSQTRRIARLDDRSRRQHRVVRTNMRRVLGGLLNGLHLLFARLVIERTHNDGLP